MIRDEVLRYAADGLEMIGTCYFNDAGPSRSPGVLVFPEASGPTVYVHSRARQLAELGYVAMACDLYGQGRLVDDIPLMRELLIPMQENPLITRARAGAAFDLLRQRSEVDPRRVAAMGYCFGGTMALELARAGADIVAAAGFHSGVDTKRPQDAVNIKCKVLVCLGSEDPVIPAKHREDFEKEMRATSVDWQLHLYGGAFHSFTNPYSAAFGVDFARYDAKWDARSWGTLMSLFAEVF
jgi:dienelactone hydrolase